MFLLSVLQKSFKKNVMKKRIEEQNEECVQPLKIIGISRSEPGCGLGRGAGGRFWMTGLKAQFSSTVS